MQSPHSDEDDEDYVMEHDPDFARLVAEDNADLAGSNGAAEKTRKRSAVEQAVADAKRRKRAKLTAQNVEDAWSEMNATPSGASSSLVSYSSSSSRSAPRSEANKAKSAESSEKPAYAGLSVQAMLALAAKKKKKKIKKKKKKSDKMTKSSQNAALLKSILRGTSRSTANEASLSGTSTPGRNMNKKKNKSVASEAALLAARKALNATQKKTIKEIVRFGNDIHEVERVIPGAASSSSVSSSSEKSRSASAPSALETLVAGLDGPQSVSTMQKTSLEWDTFKSKQGIGDELERYTKNGYLAKQDFLGRVDLRQFEQEKSQRERVRRYEESTKGKSK